MCWRGGAFLLQQPPDRHPMAKPSRLLRNRQRGRLSGPSIHRSGEDREQSRAAAHLHSINRRTAPQMDFRRQRVYFRIGLTGLQILHMRGQRDR